MSLSKRAVLIAGPTASGKSALALEKAAETGGLIVNADSMQVYDVLNILSARPGAEDLAQAAHALYGFVSPSERFSTGAWAAAVGDLVAEAEAGRVLIFVGGTGLYFDALINGIAEVPPVPDAVVAEMDALVRPLDGAQRAALILERDPEMAAQLKAPDPQRVVRALAVMQATGKSLARWQAETQRPLLEGWSLERIVLNPPRDVLRARIAQRFGLMLDGGAVDEVRALLDLKLDARLPVMKAIGVREISGFLAGEMSYESAMERAIIASQQYAKRQRTWFRNRMADWDWV